MKKDSTIPVERTVGLDVGDKYTHFCTLDADGEIVEEGKFRTGRETLRAKFESGASCRIAFEVGNHSAWMRDILLELGHEIYVANPRKLRLIYENPTKDDRVDARYLARIARLDPQLLSPITHRSVDVRVDREMLRAREQLIETRTKLINHIRGVVKSHGAKLRKCSSRSFHTQAATGIPKELWSLLSPLVDTIRDSSSRILDYDRGIESLAKTKYAETELLRGISGVGFLTSLAFVLTLEDPRRFKKSRDVGCYLGLTPRRDKSGDDDKQLRITKAGDVYLRKLLVQSGHYILGPFGTDSDLRRWGLAYLDKGGKNAKKRAVTAVARKLAVMMHRLWSNGEVYDPLWRSNRAERELQQAAQSN